jgi:tRNA uridine 5-carbamoylmethylation protein Kti12
MKLKCIINLFGGPGVGKSTVAAELFAVMKKVNYNVEFVTEYAKELTYEGRYNILEQDQLYVFAKQHRKIMRLRDKVEYIITDSPLLLSAVYSELNPYNVFDHDLFINLVYNINDKYNNLNILLERNMNFNYKQEGRYQDEAGALFVDNAIRKTIEKQKIDITPIISDHCTIEKIIALQKGKMKNEMG